MAEPKDGGPAFPLPLGEQTIHPSVAGITVRDYFAAVALPGLVPSFEPGVDSEADIAEQAYAIADAMLAERAGLAQRAEAPKPKALYRCSNPDCGFEEWSFCGLVTKGMCRECKDGHMRRVDAAAEGDHG